MGGRTIRKISQALLYKHWRPICPASLDRSTLTVYYNKNTSNSVTTSCIGPQHTYSVVPGHFIHSSLKHDFKMSVDPFLHQ